ncbi:MAG: hypothetical protein C0591_02915 [Marinilabiliales bacterium]|nr:MAG: hypothetical protein C0591_02915 [Marinilabiliales bacterium]
MMYLVPVFPFDQAGDMALSEWGVWKNSQTDCEADFCPVMELFNDKLCFENSTDCAYRIAGIQISKTNVICLFFFNSLISYIICPI